MKNNLIPAIRLTVVCLVFFCGVYTLAVWAIAQLTPGQGKGLTIVEDGHRYHINVGQNFSSDQYFWSRPSVVDYNAAGSGGSNKGPSNPDYLVQVQARIDTFMVHHPEVSKEAIPSDLVTASGSGLDPHISVQAANIQVKRIARVRGISEEQVQQLVARCTEKPLLRLFGTERINVLKLNLELENL